MFPRPVPAPVFPKDWLSRVTIPAKTGVDADVPPTMDPLATAAAIPAAFPVGQLPFQHMM